MSIRDKITVNTHYTRSVNLERDGESVDVLKAYIPTSRAIRTLERVAVAMGGGQMPRAWSLIGPYGSGKSSFSVFTADLLSSPNTQLGKIAHKKLTEVDPKLQHIIRRRLSGSEGMLKVLVTGSPEPMARRILAGFEETLETAWTKRRGKRPKIFVELQKLLKVKELQTSSVLEFVGKTQAALQRAGYSGILLVIDELGKFLEYEARHYGANDIYLLQALAERSCSEHQCNLLLFVTLHQSFEQYAKGLGEKLKNEWAKVQGRFEEIPFIESSEQVLRVVANAIEHSFSGKESKTVRAYINNAVDVLLSQDALPVVLKKREAVNLLEACYPLHPVSALVLPILCQKVAQNERTLFSYLGSREDNGLIDLVSKLNSVDDWVRPHQLFDYFISNQTATLSDYATHRRWTEVITAIERLGDAQPSDVMLLKTIGLLNIIGAKGGLKASGELLKLCFDSQFSVPQAIQRLVGKSIVTHRKFNAEYRVWQGSDFDLEEALQESLSQAGEFDLAQVLNDDNILQPVVARRYTIRSGALRYFIPHFVDAKNYNRTPEMAAVPRLILFLSDGQDDEKVFFTDAIKHYSKLDVVGLYKNCSQLREVVGEVRALKSVGTTRQELGNDPVAKREFEDRLTAAELAQDTIISQLLKSPQDGSWFHEARPLAVSGKRDFQEQLSSTLEKVFSKSPKLHNELVNRDKPSVQSCSARNKLLHAMIRSPAVEDLAIEKFPPEKAIYRSILLRTGLHTNAEGAWVFKAPEPRTPFYQVWKKIDEFLSSTEEKPRSFAEFNGVLMAPPYGVKAGILPIIYMAVYCSQQHELAMYENGQYRPVFSGEMIDRFVRHPDEFTIQRFRIVGLRASIYAEYKKLFNDDKDKTVVQLVRPLAKLIGGLEEYTGRTRSGQLSANAKGVRDAFKLSKSPEKLLFEDLPKALGYGKMIETGEGKLEGFAGDLTEALKELKHAYANMRKTMAKLLAQALHLGDGSSPLDDLMEKARGRYEGLDQHTVDVDGLKAFILRIAKRGISPDEWLDNILMFLGQKPACKWTDADRAGAEIRLSNFSKQLLDLRTLRLHYDKNSQDNEGNFEIIMLKTLKRGREPIEEVVKIDPALHEKIQDAKKDILDILGKSPDTDASLAVLAELADDFLRGHRKSGKGSSNAEPQRGTPRKPTEVPGNVK